MSRRAEVQLYSLEAEQVVLAGLMLANQTLSEVQDWLAPEDFWGADHAAIYAGIVALSLAGQPADGVTVGEWLHNQGVEDANHRASLAIDIAGSAYTAANVIPHAEIISSHSRRRRLADMLGRAYDAALHKREVSTEEIMSRVSALASELAPVNAGGLVPYRNYVAKFKDDLIARHRDGKPVGLPTPWSDLNKKIGGFRDGEVYVLAARSNMGKSTLAFQISRFNGLRNEHTAVFSMEMVGESAVARDVSALGKIPLGWVVGMESEFSAEDSDIYWSRTTPAMQKLMDASIVFDDAPQLSAPQIIARAKRAHAKKRLRLVVIDHLHEMALPGKQGEVIERGQAIRDVKGLAKQLGCPVVILAQLNRDAANGRPPEIKDIRGSGGIEEAADMILFVHRPDYYNPEDQPGVVQIIIGKGRNVRTGDVINLHGEFQYQRAVDWDDPEYEFVPPPRPAAAPESKAAPLAPRIGRRRSGYGRGGGDE